MLLFFSLQESVESDWKESQVNDSNFKQFGNELNNLWKTFVGRKMKENVTVSKNSIVKYIFR